MVGKSVNDEFGVGRSECLGWKLDVEGEGELREKRASDKGTSGTSQGKDGDGEQGGREGEGEGYLKIDYLIDSGLLQSLFKRVNPESSACSSIGLYKYLAVLQFNDSFHPSSDNPSFGLHRQADDLIP